MIRQHASHGQRQLLEKFSLLVDAVLINYLLNVLQQPVLKDLLDLQPIGQSANEILLFSFGHPSLALSVHFVGLVAYGVNDAATDQ